MLRLFFFTILSAVFATSANAVILSKEVKVQGKTVTKCVIDTAKLSISKTTGLIDEVGEIADSRMVEVQEWFSNVENEPSIPEDRALIMLASASSDQEIFVTIQDQKTVILRGKSASDKPAIVRVGPKTTKLMEFIEKHCR